jgi:hypothetical protein
VLLSQTQLQACDNFGRRYFAAPIAVGSDVPIGIRGETLPARPDLSFVTTSSRGRLYFALPRNSPFNNSRIIDERHPPHLLVNGARQTARTSGFFGEFAMKTKLALAATLLFALAGPVFAQDAGEAQWFPYSTSRCVLPQGGNVWFPGGQCPAPRAQILLEGRNSAQVQGYSAHHRSAHRDALERAN